MLIPGCRCDICTRIFLFRSYTHTVSLKVALPSPKALVYILALFAVLVGLVAFLSYLPDKEAFSWPDLIFWVVVAIWASRTTVKLPVSASISHIYIVALTLIILLPPWLSTILVFVANFNPKLGRPSYPWYKDLFNRTQLSTATALAALIWNLITNNLSFNLGLFDLTPIIAIGVAGLAFFAVNVGTVVYAIHFASGTSVRKIWSENFSWLWFSYLVISPVGLLLAQAYKVPIIGNWGGFTVLIIMLLLYYSRFYWDEKVKLEEAFDTTIEVLVSAIDAKDPYTRMHSERVAAITADLAKALGLDEPDQKKITYAARIHDVGKVGIPDSVLFKPAKLTPEEFALIKSHPTRGTELLAPMKPYLAKAVMQVILHHHERWDGAGYPSNQKGAEIPFWARIVSLSDAYEAMTAGRAYTRAKSPEEALNEIITFSGRQFDPQVVQVFEQLWLGDPLWKDREVFLSHSSSPVPFLDLPSLSSPEPAPATSPTSS